MVFFILIELFELLRKKKLIPGLISLAFATDIKYYAILLLPLIVIYYFKDTNLKTRIIKCIEYGMLFTIMIIIPYLFYFRDLTVFMGLVTQRDRVAKGLYLFIMVLTRLKVDFLKNASLIIFIVAYFCTNIKLLINKNIHFRKEMQKLFTYILAFLFLLITNFQPWYFIVLSTFMIWQKASDIKLIVQMQILLLFANIVFLMYSEYITYGIPFFISYIIGILICTIVNSNFMKNQILQCKEIMKKMKG